MQGVQDAGFSLVAPKNPTAHSHTKSAVAVAAVFIPAYATHVRTATHALPAVAAKVEPATHSVQVVGFSAVSPSKPASHSQTRSAVIVPAVLVDALLTHVRTAWQLPLPALALKVLSTEHPEHVIEPWYDALTSESATQVYVERPDAV